MNSNTNLHIKSTFLLLTANYLTLSHCILHYLLTPISVSFYVLLRNYLNKKKPLHNTNFMKIYKRWTLKSTAEWIQRITYAHVRVHLVIKLHHNITVPLLLLILYSYDECTEYEPCKLRTSLQKERWQPNEWAQNNVTTNNRGKPFLKNHNYMQKSVCATTIMFNHKCTVLMFSHSAKRLFLTS
jgi:hypothetical protein